MTEKLDPLWTTREFSDLQRQLIRKTPPYEVIRFAGEARLREVLRQTHKDLLSLYVAEAVRVGMEKNHLKTATDLRRFLGTSQTTAQRLLNGNVHRMPFENISKAIIRLDASLAFGSTKEIDALTAAALAEIRLMREEQAEIETPMSPRWSAALVSMVRRLVRSIGPEVLTKEALNDSEEWQQWILHILPECTKLLSQGLGLILTPSTDIGANNFAWDLCIGVGDCIAAMEYFPSMTHITESKLDEIEDDAQARLESQAAILKAMTKGFSPRPKQGED